MERTQRTIRISREARAEADRWGDAADDPKFREEAAQLARAFEGGDIGPDAGLNVAPAEDAAG
jgi:hypothetical protein